MKSCEYSGRPKQINSNANFIVGGEYMAAGYQQYHFFIKAS